ncbi:ATP-dependent zinc metalloprotease FtsH [bacterium]|jgi:cell division protease FtsH|nr:ATP-dependent zinc metalloprotease FtsH [bacterium]MBT5015723.1 ATP-dependent zinc metalloprotease FtsH [bacterium]
MKKLKVCFLFFFLSCIVYDAVPEHKSFFAEVAKDIIVGTAVFASVMGLLHVFKSVLVQENGLTEIKHSNDTFESVAGLDEAKEELTDIIDFLKNPEKFQFLGAHIPRGILLTGAPGNGKTLLARAIAGETGCSFYSVNGADFVELYTGVGPARMRELYKAAQQNAPSIIFIDEIDAVARHRSRDNNDHGEYDNTLLQLLVLMDGFEKNDKPVVFIGATNLQEALDSALLRPGRFDRIVHVSLPDIKNRTKILQYFADSLCMGPKVNLKEIAQTTVGFSGAHLKNLMNEAAIIASRKNRKLIAQADLIEARDKTIYGKALKSRILTEKEKKVTAVHESGHALVNLLLKKYSLPLYKITIVPHGEALGFTGMLTNEDRYSCSKEELVAQIMMLLGGRAAEEITFAQLSTGASDDFKHASRLAREMVMIHGMSAEMGTVFYDTTQYRFSEETLQKIDNQVKRIIQKCYEETRLLLAKHIRELQVLSDRLFIDETLYCEDVATLYTDDSLADESFYLPAV